MKTRFLIGALCITGLLFSCSDAEVFEAPDANLRATTTASGSGVTVQWGQEQQNIDGFGIAQAGHSNKLYSHHKRSEIMGWLFGEQGLRLSILRGEVFPIFSPSPGIYDYGFDRNLDVPFTDPVFQGLNNDAPQSVKDELLMRGQLWITREAKNTYHVDKLMFSTWSAPAYMKSNGSTVKGNLKTSEYQNYANYLANFVKTYEANGYPIYALSPANEPEYAAEWTSCLWLPGSTTLGPFIVKNLGPTFRDQGIGTKIVFGENGQWSGILGFVMGSKSYVTNIINLNPKITNFDVIAAGHGYVDPVTKKPTAIEPFKKAMDKGIPVWLTEVSRVDGFNTDIQDGLDWAADFHRYLSDASASALIWWLGATPGENNEGLMFMNMENLEDYSFSKRYETFGNFSRYIKPNSRRISIDRGNGLPTDFHISSYKNGNEMVIVMINKTDEFVTTPHNVKGIQGVTSLKRVLTDADNRWTETTVVPENGQYILDIPAKSAVTFVGTIQ